MFILDLAQKVKHTGRCDHCKEFLFPSLSPVNLNGNNQDILCKSLIITEDSELDCFKYLANTTEKCSINIKNDEGKLPLHVLLETLAYSHVNKDHGLKNY